MILLIHSLNDVNKNSNSHKIAVQLLKKYKDIINHQYIINIDKFKYLYLFNCSHRQWIKQNMYDSWKKTRGNIFDDKGIAKQISDTLTRTESIVTFWSIFQSRTRPLSLQEWIQCLFSVHSYNNKGFHGGIQYVQRFNRDHHCWTG